MALLVGCGLLTSCGSATDDQTTGKPVRGAPALGSLASSGAGHRFYEVYDAVPPVRGTMLMVHGGGWKDQRGDARRLQASMSLRFRGDGWRVINVDYSPGPHPVRSGVDPRPMVRDVVAFYDQVRRAYGGPICAYGESAGGHLAAMLAVERPSLTCAFLNAAPLDLPSLLRTSSAGAQAVRPTFGTSRSVLYSWSPAKLWDPDKILTEVFATSASNDKVVPPQQVQAFAAVVPSADTAVVPGAAAGAADAVGWMHSVVRRDPLQQRLASALEWLDRVVPRAGRTTPATDGGADCATPPAGSSAMIRDNRWKLLRAGDAWQQATTAGQAVVATRGCSGSAHWQDDGLSLWAFPLSGAILASGAEASLTLSADRVVRSVSATFRGFLSAPQDWDVGLYASSQTSGAIISRVAACERGSCSNLRLFGTAGGALIAASNSRGDPDRREKPVTADFVLPPGTRRIAWRLRCVAPAGCSQNPTAPLRRRDPLGHPAILSLYRLDVR